jgi:hypothetical protein
VSKETALIANLSRGGSAMRTDTLVWAKDDAGNRYLCPYDDLVDPNTVREKEKGYCIDDASRLKNPKTVPGEGNIKFSTYSRSPN